MRLPLSLSILLLLAACGPSEGGVLAASLEPVLIEARREARGLDTESLRKRVNELEQRLLMRRTAVADLERKTTELKKQPAKMLSDAGQALQRDFTRLKAELIVLEGNFKVYADALAER